MKNSFFIKMFFLAVLAAMIISCPQPMDNFSKKTNADDISEENLPEETGSDSEAAAVQENVWLYSDSIFQGYENLQAALDWLKDNADNDGSYTVCLGTNETIAPQTLNFGASDKIVNITLISNDENEKQISLTRPGILFRVGPYITLTLDRGITLKGRSDNDSGALVYVDKNGTLIMNDGASAKDNAGKDYGAISIEGTFIMNGGSITGNSKKFGFLIGGGVCLIDGTFTMNGGIISGNRSSNGGGVGFCSERGKNPVFYMTGGTISNNRGDFGGGVFVSYSGKFIMTGGTISNNLGIAGGGLSIEASVSSSGEFIMTGGAISNNVAECNGGGIFSSQNVTKGKLVIGGNAVISGNSVMNNPFPGNGYGGGIYSSANVVLQDNCVIEGNTAKGGAGLYFSLHQGSVIETAFTMTGGTIRANTAKEFGGGVAILHSSPYIQFHKTGGIIYGYDGGVNSNIVLNSTYAGKEKQPGNPHGDSNEDDQGEDNNAQGDNDDQGEDEDKKGKPGSSPDDSIVLPDRGHAAAIVYFNDAYSFSGIYLRKEATIGQSVMLSSTSSSEYNGPWD
jgi:hypothetical protein